MTPMDKLLEAIRNSSATATEKLDILNALSDYITKQ
jgi:hypothetical protein